MVERDESGHFVSKSEQRRVEVQQSAKDAGDNGEGAKPEASMTELEYEELKQLRAEKAAREAEAAAAPKQIQLTPEEEALIAHKRELDEISATSVAAGRVYWQDWPVADQIRDHYMHGRGTIQDYARIYRMEVDEVLHIIGREELAQVQTIGDLIDEKEINPLVDKAIQGRGRPAKVPFSTN